MSATPVKYHMQDDGSFVVTNYNWSAGFSNFFPGIAGKWGIPTWLFYVNRGQGVCSLGVRDKDHQILEFLSFNKAVALTPTHGFRTFLRIDGGAIYEPFRQVRDEAITQEMIVSSAELELREFNATLGLATTVRYYPLVNMPVPALVRELHIENRGATTRSFELCDGVPKILPYGMDLHCVQTIPRHSEGMMEVVTAHDTPLFRLSQTPNDSAEVGTFEGGHFLMSVDGQGHRLGVDRMFVDPTMLFGASEGFDQAWGFADAPLETLLKQPQAMQNRTPCAFTAMQATCGAGETVTLRSLMGRVETEARLAELQQHARDTSFFASKREENRAVIREIENVASTTSAVPAFDHYCRQTFLDNVVRGGIPLTLPMNDGTSTFYLYSKQNGDLERDYHYFALEPTYLSQGNGHYRSVLQNRRADSWFFPKIGDANLKTFMNMIQLDGYNPLEVGSQSYRVVDASGCATWLAKTVHSDDARSTMEVFLAQPFSPGAFVMQLESLSDVPQADWERTLGELLTYCAEEEVGVIHEGYWVDHWLYNLDLIDSYLMVYPDKRQSLFFDGRDYTFYDNPDVIMPRDKKCVLRNGKVRQFGAVQRDGAKEAMIASRAVAPCTMRTQHGQGNIYRTNLFTKLLCLVVNRMATLDPQGLGVEMEANKPGWNDSMNGLPGLFGSSLCQTLELQRACKLMHEALVAATLPETMPIYAELANFMTDLTAAVAERLVNTASDRTFTYWDRSNRIKESYRAATSMGIAGEDTNVPVRTISGFLEQSLQLLALIDAPEHRDMVYHPSGACHTYLINEVSRYEQLGGEYVRPLAFTQQPTPMFLEGPVHMMKVHPERAREQYTAVRESGMYDRKLQMYKVCESLADAPFEIGRVKAWGPGWIENESVYTHMEYKYLLEILRSGLYDEYYTDIQTCLMPFLKPEVYGRSPLENVSFIVSSAFPDERLHGRGFQPRLSGVTCEFLHMWLLMVAGPKPFTLDKSGALQLQLQPALADWLFTTGERVCGDITVPKDAFAFNFLGNTYVTYHNPTRKNTYGTGGVTPVAYKLQDLQGGEVHIEASSLEAPHAEAIRRGEIAHIDVQLA